MTLETNLISVELTDEVVTTAIDGVKQAETVLAFTKTIQTEDKVSLAKVGPKELDFCRKAHEYGLKNPQLTPQYLDLNELGKDITVAEKMMMVSNHMTPLTNRVNDTASIAGAEAYLSARTFYHHVKNAAKVNVPGASAIAKELGKFYDKPSVKNVTEVEEPQVEESTAP